MSIIITIANEGKAPVLCQYPQQCQPQAAYLYFRPSNDEIELVADYTGEVGNNVMSFDVYHRRELRFSISPYSSRAGLEALANDEKLEAMLAAIRAAYSCEWDGNNHVGRFVGLDDYFEEEIERHLADTLAVTEAWDAADWVGDTADLLELLEKGGVRAYADYYAELADNDGAVLLGDCEQYLAQWAEEEIAKFIRQNVDGNANYRRAAELLSEYDADEYGYLMADYIAEFDSAE